MGNLLHTVQGVICPVLRVEGGSIPGIVVRGYPGFLDKFRGVNWIDSYKNYMNGWTFSVWGG